MTDDASRGFLVLELHFATPRPTLQRALSLYQHVLVLTCYLATVYDRRFIAWFPSVSVSFGCTLNFDLVMDDASRGFLVLACHWATP